MMIKGQLLVEESWDGSVRRWVGQRCWQKELENSGQTSVA